MNELDSSFLERLEELQPTEDRKDFIARSQELKLSLDKGISRIDDITDASLRSIALIKLREELGLRKDEFLALVEQLSRFREEQPPDDFAQLKSWAEAKRQAPIIEDILGVGLTVFAADGSSSKTSFAYEAAEAITKGSSFAGQFQAQHGAVVFVQCDESPTDAAVKWQRMSFDPEPDKISFFWAFTPLMIPELAAKVRATNAKLVVMDSLISIAGGTISAKDAEFGLMLYRLNRLASELNISILLIHHLAKEKNRKVVSKEDIYGTAFILNATADCWGYWRNSENNDPQFILRSLKARSNTIDIGTTYLFDGNEEDHRIIFRGFGDRAVSLDELKSKREKVAALLRQDPGRRWTGKQVSDHFGWNGVRYAEKVLTDLFTARAGVNRVSMPSSGGRRAYGYYSVSRG